MGALTGSFEAANARSALPCLARPLGQLSGIYWDLIPILIPIPSQWDWSGLAADPETLLQFALRVALRTFRLDR